MGKAIVATTVGAEGYPVTHNKDLVLADTPLAMAEAIVRLLEDQSARQRLGTQAYQFAQGHYTWENLVPQMESLYGKSRESPFG